VRDEQIQTLVHNFSSGLNRRWCGHVGFAPVDDATEDGDLCLDVARAIGEEDSTTSD